MAFGALGSLGSGGGGLWAVMGETISPARSAVSALPAAGGDAGSRAGPSLAVGAGVRRVVSVNSGGGLSRYVH